MRARLLAAVAALSALALPPASGAPRFTLVDGRVNGQQLVDAQTPVLSDDGRFVVFQARFGENSPPQAAMYDRKTRRITLASRTAKGAFADGYTLTPRISGDGRYVAFFTGAQNLATGDKGDFDSRKVYVRDLKTGRMTRFFRKAVTWTSDLELSRDGRWVFLLGNEGRSKTVMGVPTFQNDSVGLVFRGDTRTGKWAGVRLLDPAGTPIDVNTSSGIAVSRDGRYLTFFSDSSGAGLLPEPTRLFVADLVTGKTREIPTGTLFTPMASAPGPLVMDAGATTIAFRAYNYRYDDARIYLADVRTGTLKSTALPVDWRNFGTIEISGNGRTVAVLGHSLADDPDDGTNSLDVMAYDVSTGKLSVWVEPRSCPPGTVDDETNCPAALGAPALSFDGRTMVIVSNARFLANDADTTADAYVVEGR